MSSERDSQFGQYGSRAGQPGYGGSSPPAGQYHQPGSGQQSSAPSAWDGYGYAQPPTPAMSPPEPSIPGAPSRDDQSAWQNNAWQNAQSQHGTGPSSTQQSPPKKSGAGAAIAILVLMLGLLVGGAFAWYNYDQTANGSISIDDVRVFETDNGQAYIAIDLTYNSWPKDGDMTDIVMELSSIAFIDGPVQFDWKILSTIDDSDATNPDAAPPEGETVSLQLNIDRHLRDTVNYERGQLYIQVDMNWRDRRRARQRVDVQHIYPTPL